MTSASLRKLLRAYAGIVAGSAGYCISFNWLFVPNQIGFGGVTGIAQVINALFPALPIGILVFVLNLPLFYLGWRHLGGHLLASSLFAMVLTSLGLDLLSSLHTFQPMDPMLASVFGGVIIGLSLGLIFSQGATTGGSDLAARLIKLKLPWLPLGKVLLAVDMTVVIAVGLAFGQLYSALYGIIALFVSSYFTDTVLYGLNKAKVAYIISEHPEQVIQAIGDRLERGITILHATGAYSRKNKQVLMCAFSQKEIVTLKHLVFETDPDAFVIVHSAHEVTGNGFRPYQKDEI